MPPCGNRISRYGERNYCTVLGAEMETEYLRIDVEVVGDAFRPTDSLVLTTNPSRSFGCRKSKVQQQFGSALNASLFFDKAPFLKVSQDVCFEYNPGFSRTSIRDMCEVPEENWGAMFDQIGEQHEGMVRVLQRRLEELDTLKELVRTHGWSYRTFKFLEQADVLVLIGAFPFVPYDADPSGLDCLIVRAAQLLESKHEALALVAAQQLLRLLELDGGFNNDSWRLIHGVTKRCSSSVRLTSMQGPLSQLCKDLYKKTERFKA